MLVNMLKTITSDVSIRKDLAISLQQYQAKDVQCFH